MLCLPLGLQHRSGHVDRSGHRHAQYQSSGHCVEKWGDWSHSDLLGSEVAGHIYGVSRYQLTLKCIRHHRNYQYPYSATEEELTVDNSSQPSGG
jgi:hypothetical protein